MKVTNRVDERLVDLAAALSVVTMQGREPVAKMVADELAEAFGGAALAFRTMPAAKGWEVDFYYGKDVRRDAGPGLPDQIRSRLDPYLPTAPTRWSTYDALRPEPAQRDLVFGPREMQAIYESGNSPIVRVIYEPLGLTTVPHMRVLVCDGPFLLGWFGLWRQEPLSRTDTHRLAHLVAPLRRRLRIERMLDGSISVEGVARALEAIDAPAFLVRGDGALEFANEAGRALFERQGGSLVRSLKSALEPRRETADISVTRLEATGIRRRAIVVMRGEGESGAARLALATRRWALTGRQAEVLALLARGDANKDIATKLRCGARTAELHVAALLAKARVESRAKLIAKFWSEV